MCHRVYINSVYVSSKRYYSRTRRSGTVTLFTSNSHNIKFTGLLARLVNIVCYFLYVNLQHVTWLVQRAICTYHRAMRYSRVSQIVERCHWWYADRQMVLGEEN